MALDAGILMFSCMVTEEFSVNSLTKKWHIFSPIFEEILGGIIVGR